VQIAELLDRRVHQPADLVLVRDIRAPSGKVVRCREAGELVAAGLD
jgi:hypothetical protein